MTNINVVFPKSGPPVVFHENEAVIENNEVFWHVRADNTKIKHVKISFRNNSRDRFFPTQPSKQEHEFTKKLEKRGKRMHGKVYGTAPSLPGRSHRRTHKYTVEALDKNEKPFKKRILLDPQIVSVRP